MKTIDIILADDHKVLRQGLKSLLDEYSGFNVIAEADDGLMAVKLARKLEPDVVILDVGMPNMNGIEATRHIVNEVKNTKVLALSMHTDQQFVSRMFQSGASGYLLKDCAFEELIQAVQTVNSGKVYLSKDITGLIVNDYISKVKSDKLEQQPALTSREREILQLIAEGNSTSDIADIINVSTKTVETHRKNIMDKLDIHNIAKLTKYAVREGLTSL